MKDKIYNIFTKTTYYPRILLDSLIFLFIKNDYSILNEFIGRDFLIVGNGPSLKNTDLENIDMISIGMNKINLLFDKTVWRPNIIVCVNGLVIKQNSFFFNSTNIPLILPVKALYLGIKKRPNVIFVKVSDYQHFNPDIKKSVSKGSTVTYTCLQVGAFLNAKSINIVGVDHYFKLEESSKSKGNVIESFKGDDENHFDPNYFKGNLWGLPDLVGSERDYRQAKMYFDSKMIPVVDYTINGNLTVFPKGDINKLLNTKS